MLKAQANSSRGHLHLEKGTLEGIPKSKGEFWNCVDFLLSSDCLNAFCSCCIPIPRPAFSLDSIHPYYFSFQTCQHFTFQNDCMPWGRVETETFVSELSQNMNNICRNIQIDRYRDSSVPVFGSTHIYFCPRYGVPEKYWQPVWFHDSLASPLVLDCFLLLWLNTTSSGHLGKERVYFTTEGNLD